ncbi:sensor histidine kinase [Actinocorallia sp. A-T 12471]|uniref:sensor histidine kinase n=1 Tax=Actinocorallia sp. A-T 12471 TaxID=3089813 RepID=UPI0029CC1FC7|nr:sensor domain-containing protein [Actinocorallia sp. A-T 12471]MDX6743747.1 sensor domain-containing protein [Actinocorallia sp. A-T 12471]
MTDPRRTHEISVPKPLDLVRDASVYKAALYFPLTSPLGLAWLVILAGGVPLAAATTIIWVGLLVWALLLVLLRAGSMLDRRLIGAAFGVRIPDPYRQAPQGGLLARGKTILGDPATWKDLAFQVVRIPLAFGYFTGSLIMWALTFALIFAPVGGQINEGFVPEFGSYEPRIDSWYDGVPFTLVGLLLFVCCLYVVKAVGVAHVALARVLLGPSEKQALRVRTTELQASRARGVDAAEAERRRIERDLHDGAQHSLLGVAMDIGRARTKIDSDPEAARALIEQAHDGARAAIAELRDLARGIYPAILTDRGLEAALSALAGRSPVPVTISVSLPERPPAAVESIAYFTVAEALTNVAKHAAAGQAAVDAFRDGDRVVVEIRDDGRGGAEQAPGGGLAGLADRAATIDGTLTVDSPEGGPTIVRAVLPCSW